MSAPLVMLVAACGSDSTTSPKSAPAADTLALGQFNTGQVQFYIDSTATPANTEYDFWNDDNEYVEIENNGAATQSWDTRAVMWATLPTLAGHGVVDSAKMYQYQCDWEGAPFTNSAVVLDHANWGAVMNDSAAFNNTLQDSVATVSSDTTTGWRAMNITSAIQGDYAAKRAATQYRLRLSQQTYQAYSDNWVEFDNGYDDGDCVSYNNNSASQGYIVIWSH
jgi:hypothetical protein